MEEICLSLNLENLPNEEWRDIFNGKYQVSNYSRVKNIDKKEKIVKKHLIKGRFMVFLKVKKKYKGFLPYRLCAEVFLRNDNNLPDVIHLDGNLRNDVISNLKWGKREIPRNPRKGENHGRALLTFEKVDEIRSKRNQGFSFSELAEIYGVSVGCIQGAVTRNWRK